MGKRFVQCVALLALAALVTITWVSGAGAVTPVAACGALTVAGETYNLTTDLVSAAGDCLTVAANRITINLKGFCIFGSGSGSGITDAGVARDQTTVNGAPPPGPPAENGCVEGFDIGIDLLASTRSTIRNIEASDNSSVGIGLGTKSTIKACEVEGNGVAGIIIGDFGTVQDCWVGVNPDDSPGNGIVGILAANVATVTLAHHMVITGNWASGNGAVGIATGDFSTVSFNDASANGALGVFAGDHSTVTGNTADFNGFSLGCDDCGGIVVGGFSAVSNNSANVNFDHGIEVGGHSTVTGNTTDFNGDIGLEVECPGTPPSGGTVTNNQSSGNGVADYEFDGTGCVLNNNT